jgi:hypothetical protein
MGKGIFGASLVLVGGIVAVVHYQQESDRKEMKKGIARDLARMAAKKKASLNSSQIPKE